MGAVQVGQFGEEGAGVVEQEVGDDGDERGPPQQLAEGLVRGGLGPAPPPKLVLISVDAMDGVVAPDLGAHGDAPRAAVEGREAGPVLEEGGGHGERGHGAGDDAGDRLAARPAAGRVGDVGGDDHRGAALQVELAGHQGAEVGEGRLRPVDGRRAVPGLPLAEAGEVVAGAVDEARVDAARQLLHAPADDQFDVPDFLPGHQRVFGVEAHGKSGRRPDAAAQYAGGCRASRLMESARGPRCLR